MLLSIRLSSIYLAFTSVSEVYATQSLMKTTLDIVQCHGGGYMCNYTVERLLRESKLIEIAAGANEIMKHLIWKLWLKEHQALRKSLRKTVTKSTVTGPEAKEKILDSLAAFYRQHPALYMERGEMMEKVGLNREDLDEHLKVLESEKLVALYRKRGGIALIKATYEGLKQAKPQEYYTFFPEFVDKEREIF